jgi:hypothetical protein
MVRAMRRYFPRTLIVRARDRAARASGALLASCAVRSSWFDARW